MPKTCSQCGARLTTQAAFCSQCGARQEGRLQMNTRKKRGQRLNLPLFVLIVGALLLVASAAAYLGRSQPTPAVPGLPSPQTGLLPYPEVERIDLAEAKARYDDGSALFLDVRIIESYERAHIPDALSMPLAVLPTRYQQ